MTSKQTRSLYQPGYKQDSVSDRTWQKIRDNWLPISSEALRIIKKRLHHGQYSKDRDQLIDDIKSDPGLFLYVTRALATSTTSTTEELNPLSTIRSLQDSELNELLDVPPSKISGHRLTRMSKQQALRLQYSLLTAHTAAELAKQSPTSADDAFASSMLRQIGLDLLAWNFPTQYEGAVRKQRLEQVDLDQTLEELLGVSPTTIGKHFAEEWKLNNNIRNSLNCAAVAADEPQAPDETLNMNEILELAELHAQSKDEENYPDATTTLAERSYKYMGTIDCTVFERTEQKVYDVITNNVPDNHVIDSLPLIASLSLKSSNRARRLFASNSHIQKCTPDVQQLFEEAYKQINDQEYSYDALKALGEIVVPMLGFPRGCVYLQQGSDLALNPMFTFGDENLDYYWNLLTTHRTEIFCALNSTIPLRHQTHGINNRTTTQICGNLDNFSRPGVLYLELLEESARFAGHPTVTYFHAIRTTVNACMSTE